MWKTLSEQALTTAYDNEIKDFWQSKVVQDSFTGEHGINIQYATVQPAQPVAHLVFSNGRIETLVKYKAFAYECYLNNIALYMLDHRGQGLSGRMQKDSQRGYVDNFVDYTKDLARFVEQVVLPVSKSPPVLACHSMGCAVGYLTALQHPELFSRVMFCSPMFGIKPSIPAPLLDILLSAGLLANRWFGRKAWYAFGQGPYIEIPFQLNTLTHSEIRYRQFRAEYKQLRSLQLGGVTYHWLAEATKAMAHIESTAKDFHLPTRVLVSGADKVVDNRRIRRVVAQLPNATVSTIEGARHELLFESDSYRDQAINALFDFVCKPQENPAEHA